MDNKRKHLGSDDRDNLSDHDLLLCLDVKMGELRTQFSNHLRHHEKSRDRQWAVTIAALTAGFMGLASCVVGLIILFVNK